MCARTVGIESGGHPFQCGELSHPPGSGLCTRFRRREARLSQTTSLNCDPCRRDLHAAYLSTQLNVVWPGNPPPIADGGSPFHAAYLSSVARWLREAGILGVAIGSGRDGSIRFRGRDRLAGQPRERLLKQPRLSRSTPRIGGALGDVGTQEQSQDCLAQSSRPNFIRRYS